MIRPALQLTMYDPPAKRPDRARPLCNDSCQNARRDLCECRCLGANHGIAHQIASNQELFEFSPPELAATAQTQTGQ